MSAVPVPQPRFLLLITALFTGTLIISNIVAVKIADYWGNYLDSANIVFPISYILGDVLTEVYGYRQARKVIWSAFLANAFAVGAIVIAGQLQPAPFWTDQESYDAILGQTWRLVGASFVAFLAGEFANSFILARMKVKTNGRFLWSRTIGSTFVGEGIDSVLFVLIAFSGTGIPDLQTLIWKTWLFKTAFEVLATPFTYVVVTALKRFEGIDAYDRDINFNPVAVWESP